MHARARSRAKLYLLMVMLFRGTYLFILRQLLGWLLHGSSVRAISRQKCHYHSATPFTLPLNGTMVPILGSRSTTQLPFRSLARLPPSRRRSTLGANTIPEDCARVCVTVCSCVCTARVGVRRSDRPPERGEHWGRNKERNC